MKLPDLFSKFWKVAIVPKFFAPFAQWDDYNEYKNLYVGQKKPNLWHLEVFLQFWKIEIFSNLVWLNLQKFAKICDFGRFWGQCTKFGINYSILNQNYLSGRVFLNWTSVEIFLTPTVNVKVFLLSGHLYWIICWCSWLLILV